MKEINILAREIETTKGEVKFKSTELGTALIQNNAEILKELNVNASDIRLSPSGEIIIRNEDLLKKVIAAKDKEAETNFLNLNGICGLLC